MTRVTHRTIQESTLANLQGNLATMGKLQEQLSTGKKINRPSDDPTGTVQALQTRQTLRANEQYSRNADDGVAWLNTTDTALGTVAVDLLSVQQLVTTGLSDGSQSDGSRAALAIQVRNIKDALLGTANTKYMDRTIFAGTSGWDSAIAAPGDALPTTPASTATGYQWAPTGTGSVDRQIDAGSRVRVDTPGASVFGTGATSVFALLDDISTQLTGNDMTGLNQSLTALQSRMAVVSGARADVGARTNRVEAAKEGAEDMKVTLKGQLSAVEDIDLPETIIQLQTQEVAYKAALGATAKVLQPSLMDFLR